MLQRSQWHKHQRVSRVLEEEGKDSPAATAAAATMTSAAAAIAGIHYDRLDTVSTSEEPGPEYESDAGVYLLEDSSEEEEDEEEDEEFQSDSEFDSENDDVPIGSGDAGGGRGGGTGVRSILYSFTWPW